MPNQLVIALAQSKKTFEDVRIFLYRLFNNNQKQVIDLENTSIDICIPYYIRYIESRGVDFNEAVNYCNLTYNGNSYWEIIKITIIAVFRKLEVEDYNYVPY